jgi:hypothetical protein
MGEQASASTLAAIAGELVLADRLLADAPQPNEMKGSK